MSESVAKARPKRRLWWVWALLICAAGEMGYLFFPHSTQGITHDQAKKAGPADSPEAHAVPILAAVAHKGDMPVYLNGLGSVTAFNTVTVRSRVDGQVIKIAFQEGKFVKEGDLLAEIDPRPFEVQLEQAEGQLARDQALLKNSRIDLDRYRVLFEEDSIPRQQLDTQYATVNQYEGNIKSDQAQVDNAKLQLVYCHITSPLTGRIGLRLVDQGNIVHANDANGLAVITQLQPIAVIFNIAEDSLPQVVSKMHAGRTLRVEAYDRDLKHRLAEGTLLTIDNQIDQSSGTVRFKAVFENKDLSLFPNQFVNARLLVDTRHGTVIVPTAAIQRSPQSTFVYVVKKEDSAVEVREVAVGLVEGDDASIDSGLQPSDLVVIDGIDKLRPGMRVNARIVGTPARG